MSNSTLLIDANSIGFAAQATTRLTANGMETQSAFGFIRTMLAIRKTYPRYTPMVLWDGKADWRYKLHPDYKSNRNADAEKVRNREAYKAMRPYIAKMLNTLGVRQLTGLKHEADDLGGLFARKLSAAPGSKVGLITGDGDWVQLVRGATATSGEVWWRDMRDDSRFIDSKNFYAKTGCLTPFAYLETKILTGDTSDVISGVGGIGDKGAPEFIAEFGSVREFWRRCDSGEYVPKLKAHQRLWKGTSPFTKEEWVAQQVLTAEVRTEKEEAKLKKQWVDAWPGQGRSIYKRNFQLMQLLKVEPPEKADVRLDTGKFDKDAFANICEELNFISLLRNMNEFVSYFQ